MAILRAGLVVLALAAFSAAMLATAAAVAPGSRALDALAGLACRTLLRLLRVRVVVTGQPAANRLLVANHVSWLDVLAVGGVEPVRFLAKREVGAWPVVSTLARLRGTVFVDRSRRRLLPQVNRAMGERLQAGDSVLLFPEGTTFDGSRRGRFHTSHLASLRDRMAMEPARSACIVQAVALRYDDPVAAWIGDDTLVPHVWAVLRHPGLTCTLAYGDPREVCPGFDRKRLGADLAAEVERLVAGMPATR